MQIRDYLFSQKDLNLSRIDEANVASNVIYLMEMLPPPKQAALAFLDSGGAVPAPPRLVGNSGWSVTACSAALQQPRNAVILIGWLRVRKHDPIMGCQMR